MRENGYAPFVTGAEFTHVHVSTRGHFDLLHHLRPGRRRERREPVRQFSPASRFPTVIRAVSLDVVLVVDDIRFVDAAAEKLMFANCSSRRN